MTKPVIDDFSELVLRGLSPLDYADEENDWALRSFVGANGLMYDVIYGYAKDTIIDGKRAPGWAVLVHLYLCPNEGLGWLAQFIGVSLQYGLNDAEQREWIHSTDGWKRGSVAAFAAAAKPYLTGSKTVIFRERYTSAYHVLVVTRTYETPDPTIVVNALLRQKPAGLVMEYHTVSGRIYLEVKEQNANYTAAKAAYVNYDAMRATRTDVDVPTTTPLVPSEILAPGPALAPGG